MVNARLAGWRVRQDGMIVWGNSDGEVGATCARADACVPGGGFLSLRMDLGLLLRSP